MMDLIKLLKFRLSYHSFLKSLSEWLTTSSLLMPSTHFYTKNLWVLLFICLSSKPHTN